nr:MAG TPA: DNA polymerase I [Caudoviricetes sp.]
MMKPIYIDFETYSSEDIKSGGAYRYTQSPDFEILLIGYAVGNGAVNIIDMTRLDAYDRFADFTNLILDEQYTIVAHNAQFERLCLKAYGIDIPADRFMCTATMALYAGFPESLSNLSKALDLKEGKKGTGLALIKFFCQPQKPTKADPEGYRNYSKDFPDKWEEFIYYLRYDVLSEREALGLLDYCDFPQSEIDIYRLDQDINDNGIAVDMELAERAEALNDEYCEGLKNYIKTKYSISSLKSTIQLKDFVLIQTGKNFDSFRKEDIEQIMQECDNERVDEVMNARKIINKTSNAKYTAMRNCVCFDGRVHGLYRFYGAGRTGRWAGRLVQMQNLPRNYIHDLDGARDNVKHMCLADFETFWGNVPDTLSQLIRTTFVAPEGTTFHIADYSAIEARVLACLCREEWRIDAFKHSKDIYAVSASMTFGLPVEECGKGTHYRQQGKVTELALGYGGWVGAMSTMDYEKAIDPALYKDIILRWRDASPRVVEFWEELDSRAKLCIRNKKDVEVIRYGVHVCTFQWFNENNSLAILLPSGRRLFYPFCRIATKSVHGRDREVITYKGQDLTGKWADLDTYGGKLTENITQAISRDLLAFGMQTIVERYPMVKIVGHIHDETVNETPLDDFGNPVVSLEEICTAMAATPKWADVFGIPLKAEGFTSNYYKKD